MTTRTGKKFEFDRCPRPTRLRANWEDGNRDHPARRFGKSTGPGVICCVCRRWVKISSSLRTRWHRSELMQRQLMPQVVVDSCQRWYLHRASTRITLRGNFRLIRPHPSASSVGVSRANCILMEVAAVWLRDSKFSVQETEQSRTLERRPCRSSASTEAHTKQKRAELTTVYRG